MLAEAGETAQAIEHLDRVLQLQPGHAEARYQLSPKLLLEGGDLQQGILELEKVTAQKPDQQRSKSWTVFGIRDFPPSRVQPSSPRIP